MPKWDIHTHTELGSYCSKMSSETLVESAARAGLDGICIVDHAPPFGPDVPSQAYDETRAYGTRLGVRVIIGTEVSHIHRNEEEHFLVFLHNEERLLDVDASSYLNNEWQLRCARKEGGVVIHAHPNHIESYTLLEFADAVEIANGLTWRGYGVDPDEAEFAASQTGGSDAHRPETVGLCYTYFERVITSVEEIIVEIRLGRCRPVVSENSPLASGNEARGEMDRHVKDWKDWWEKTSG